jgi:hypothetical protein
MSDSTPGTPAAETGAADQGPVDEPAGPGTAGDTLGGAEAPTGNDGTMGADAVAGDAGLSEAPDPGAAREGTQP